LASSKRKMANSNPSRVRNWRGARSRRELIVAPHPEPAIEYPHTDQCR
jgi:hypothetical protein